MPKLLFLRIFRDFDKTLSQRFLEIDGIELMRGIEFMSLNPPLEDPQHFQFSHNFLADKTERFRFDKNKYYVNVVWEWFF